MEQALFDQHHQRQLAEEAESEVPPRRSAHSRSGFERAKDCACGDSRTKEGCAGCWIMIVVVIYGVFGVFVLLNCSSDTRCNPWIAWLLLIIGTVMVAAISFNCFKASSESGESGCSRCLCGSSLESVFLPKPRAEMPFSAASADHHRNPPTEPVEVKPREIVPAKQELPPTTPQENRFVIEDV